jgi:hypothetical protein
MWQRLREDRNQKKETKKNLREDTNPKNLPLVTYFLKLGPTS